MHSYLELAKNTYCFTSGFPVDGGILPVNRFAVSGSAKSMIIDTGAKLQAEDTLKQLAEVMNPQELDYIFVSHMDAEHCGGVHALLEIAPKARVLGNPTSFGKGISLYGIPMERFAIVLPGEEIDLGDRVVRVEDSFIEDGHTSWLFDTKERVYFSSDAFGSIQFGSQALFAEEQVFEAFAKGFAVWQSMNFHTLPMLDVKKFQEAVRRMQAQEVQQIASVHGPIVRQDLGQVFELMAGMPTAELPAPPPFPDFLRLK